MKKITTKNYYFISLCFILFTSIYPIIMGAQVLIAYISEGFVDSAAYPKYIIPYTPICIALIVTVALLPLAVKLCKKYAHLAASSLGIALFLLTEIGFEQVTVFDGNGVIGIGSWQAFLCYVTPEALQTQATLGEVLAARYSPVFKLHFYLIAILIVLAVLGVVYGFYAMIRKSQYDKKKPLIVQTVSVTVFIGLCIFACFTAFYRTGDINISALSSVLMSVFFILFGITAGSYAGGGLYGKKLIFSRIIPAIIATLTTFVMYIGELVMMGGALFKFGSGLLFDSLPGIPFAMVDIIVIIASGLLTFMILSAIRQKESIRTDL